MLRRVDAARRGALHRLPLPGGTVAALAIFGTVAAAVALLAVLGTTAPGSPSAERRPATPRPVQQSPAPTTTASSPVLPPIDATAVHRAGRALGVTVRPPIAQPASNTRLSVYTNATDGLRRRFESGAAYVSLINVAHRRETISDERRLVALLALADLAKATEEDLQSLTPPGIATTYHFRLLNVLSSYAVAARQYWQATVRPTADTVDSGTRRRQLNGVLDAAFRYNTLPSSPLDADALGEP
ncbi:MAG: hypothetical protein OXR64_12035 [Chloroflexota bacterium]|nr:hypothetical protein [Chloroflexota bacterium]MDE2920554.1 hypothetical protein [Chloroflexota bacterium]